MIFCNGHCGYHTCRMRPAPPPIFLIVRRAHPCAPPGAKVYGWTMPAERPWHVLLSAVERHPRLVARVVERLDRDGHVQDAAGGIHKTVWIGVVTDVRRALEKAALDSVTV